MDKVVITDHGFPTIDPERGIIEGAGFHLRDVQPICKTEDDVIRECKDADVLLVQWAPITRKVLESLPNVKCVVRYGIGVNNIDLNAAKDLKVTVANVPEYCLEEVSNHAVAMVLALARRIPHNHHLMTQGGWGIGPFFPFPATSEMTLGLVGFGNIARAVARKSRVFDFDIIAYDPYAADTVFADFGVKRVDLDTLLKTSDIISIHCPLTEDTTHISASQSVRLGAIFGSRMLSPCAARQEVAFRNSSGSGGVSSLFSETCSW